MTLTCIHCGHQRCPQPLEFTVVPSQKRNTHCPGERCRTMRLHLVAATDEKPADMDKFPRKQFATGR